MTLWLRPQSPLFTFFCSMRTVDADTTRTHCGGSWPTASTYVLIGVDVRELECRGCRSAMAMQPALAELRDAPAIRTAELHTAPRDGVLFAFDMSEDES